MTILVSSNLTRPFGDIVQVLQNVPYGRLDRRVAVRSNDEVGYVGDVINEMAAGLRKRTIYGWTLVNGPTSAPL